MCSFPRIIVDDFDKKLPHNVDCIPFWNHEWVRDFYLQKGKRIDFPLPINVRDAFKFWLEKEAIKIPEDYTLGIDSWTNVQNIFDIWAENNEQEFLTKVTRDNPTPEFNQFAFYARKIMYSLEIITILKSLRCRVVVTFHEFQRRVKGELSGRFMPLMDGSFVNQLVGHFGTFVRQKRAGDRVLVQLAPNDSFLPSISPAYRIPPGLKDLDITDKSFFEELEKFSIR